MRGEPWKGNIPVSPTVYIALLQYAAVPCSTYPVEINSWLWDLRRSLGFLNCPSLPTTQVDRWITSYFWNASTLLAPCTVRPSLFKFLATASSHQTRTSPVRKCVKTMDDFDISSTVKCAKWQLKHRYVTRGSNLRYQPGAFFYVLVCTMYYVVENKLNLIHSDHCLYVKCLQSFIDVLREDDPYRMTACGSWEQPQIYF